MTMKNKNKRLNFVELRYPKLRIINLSLISDSPTQPLSHYDSIQVLFNLDPKSSTVRQYILVRNFYCPKHLHCLFSATAGVVT